MKLRENLKKEDFYGCFFGIQNLQHGEDLQNALFSLGFEWFESSGLHAYGSGFLITMPFGPRIVHNPKLFPFSFFTEKKLSDLIEPVSDPEEYAYQMNKKAFDEVFGNGQILRPNHERLHAEYQGFAIAEEQIATLATINDTVKAQLREFFPEAKCLQPEKKTYSIGQKFKWVQKGSDYDGEIWQLNRFYGHNEVGLNDEDGCLMNRSTHVEDIYKVTEAELNRIRNNFFEYLKPI